MKKKSGTTGALTVSEWVCEHHGVVASPKNAKAARCGICGSALTRSTWKMNG